MRGTLTTEVWETQNQTWLEFKRMLRDERLRSATRAQFFEWVKFRSHLSRGVTVGTMLQDEAFHFLRIGTLPRARRQHRAPARREVPRASRATSSAPPSRRKDQEYDFYHWSAILRSVSGFEVYRKVYRNVITPGARGRTADPARPTCRARCTPACTRWCSTCSMVANEQSADTLRLAGRLQADLQYGRIDEILATGLHAYLTQFLERVNALGAGISRDFLVPVAP